jgi:hypothetical protein
LFISCYLYLNPSTSLKVFNHRVCLAPDEYEEFESLFENSGELAEIFQLASGGIEITEEANKHEALICKLCIKEIKRSFEVMKLIQKADRVYFATIRKMFARTRMEATNRFEETDFVTQTGESTVAIRREEEQTLNQENESQIAEILNENVVEENLEMEIEIEEIQNDSETFKIDFNCDICGEKFEEKNQIIEHISSHQTKKLKSIQKKQKSFTCSICNKTFGTKCNFNRHINSVHKKIKNFSCDLCPKKFYFTTYFNIHKKLHENPKSSVNIDETRKFKCDVENCLRSFDTKRNLKRHKTFVHSDQKRFKCHCGNFFKYKISLKAHQKKIHKHPNLNN